MPTAAPLESPRISVREAVFDLFRGLGMTTIFGNPGSTELTMLRDFPSDFRYVLGLQEAAVVAMADGFAQGTGKPAVVSLHSASGVGHALGSVFTAYRNRTPMVIIAGQQSRAILPFDPFLHAEQATEFPRPYVKFSIEPARAEDVPLAFARACHVAMQPPRGPVFVSVPVDDWDRETTRVVHRAVQTASRADAAVIDRIAAAITSAKSPAIVVGSEVDRDGAWDLAVELAERAGASVYNAPNTARCSFPESHPLFRGFLPAMREKIVDRLKGHDLALVLGAPVFTYHIEGFGEFVPTGCEIIQITEDGVAATAAAAGESVVGSPRLALIDLLARPMQRKAWHVPERSALPALEPSDPIQASFVMQTLARLCPENCLIAHETPSASAARQQYLPIDTPQSLYQTASGGLGFSLPAAVGLALARPDRKVIATCGDGSSMYGIQALWTAADLKLPVTFVIFNNRKYKTLQTFAGYFDMPPDIVGIGLGGLDFVALARGHGCEAVRVERAERLEDQLRIALAAPRPTLVEVIVA